jgi:sirohydrochlorin ferrochelatase
VLAAAGSSDERAVVDCRRAGELLAERLGVPVSVGFLSAAEPALPEAVAAARTAAAGAPVYVSPYLLAPGYFLDLVDAAGADVVAAPLLTPESTPPELVEIVAERADAVQTALGGASLARSLV